jgi:predicted acyl esterase
MFLILEEKWKTYDAWPQNTVKQDFFLQENKLSKMVRKYSFEEFVSDPKKCSFLEDILQVLPKKIHD